MVTLRDLQTDYGVEDLYKLLEVGMVNAHNERVITRLQQQRLRQMQQQAGV